MDATGAFHTRNWHWIISNFLHVFHYWHATIRSTRGERQYYNANPNDWSCFGSNYFNTRFSWLDAAGNEFQESFKFIFNLVGGGLFLFLLTTLPWPQVWFRKI